MDVMGYYLEKKILTEAPAWFITTFPLVPNQFFKLYQSAIISSKEQMSDPSKQSTP
jgi:hypothetical protein